MVGIFSRFSVGRSTHRRTQSAIVSSLFHLFTASMFDEKIQF